MALHIVIDARRIRDFGIGTYIRSLVHALGAIDTVNRYSLVSGRGRCAHAGRTPRELPGRRSRAQRPGPLDNLLFPAFVHGLSPDLVHIPLNHVPMLMIRPYVVTVHDMANVYFEGDHSGVRMQLRRFRFRRGLVRASRVIAVSDSTKRDVRGLPGLPLEPHTARLQRPGSRLPRPGRHRAGRTAAHPGALPDHLSVSAVCRQHPPPQERAAPGGGLRGGSRAAGRPSAVPGPAPGDHRRHHLAIPRRAADGDQEPRRARGPLPGLRPLRYAAVFLRIGRGVRVSRRATKGSGCRRSKPWHAARRW